MFYKQCNVCLSSCASPEASYAAYPLVVGELMGVGYLANWPKTGATHSHKLDRTTSRQIRTIKWLVVCNSLHLESLNLLNRRALGCHQPSLGV